MDIKSLEAYGADTAEGLARCMNNESFYLRMVSMVLEDSNFEALRSAMEARDANAAFEAAHALKGAVGNVSLTPIFGPVCELTEALRGSEEIPAGSEALMEQIMESREKALSL